MYRGKITGTPLKCGINCEEKTGHRGSIACTPLKHEINLHRVTDVIADREKQEKRRWENDGKKKI